MVSKTNGQVLARMTAPTRGERKASVKQAIEERGIARRQGNSTPVLQEVLPQTGPLQQASAQSPEVFPPTYQVVSPEKFYRLKDAQIPFIDAPRASGQWTEAPFPS